MPSATPTTSMIVALVAGVGGVQVLSFLLRAARRRPIGTGTPLATVMPDWSRRGFLIQAGAVAVALTAAGLIGRRLLEGGAVGRRHARHDAPTPGQRRDDPGRRRDPQEPA